MQKILKRTTAYNRKVNTLINEKNELFRFIVDYASDAIIPMDIYGKIVFWNKAAEKMFGYKADEIIGEPITKIMPTSPQMQSEEPLIIGETLGKKFEAIGIRKDGSKFPVEFSYSAWDSKHGLFLTVIARDITRRKRDEERIKQSERMFRELFETNVDGVVMTDLKGCIVDCNKAYAEMLGYSRDELKGINIKQLTPEKWHENEEKTIKERILKREFSNEYEKEYKRKDGTIFPAAVKAWLIRDEDGKPKGMWAIVRDITEQKAIEKKREKYTKSLEGLVAQKSKELEEAQAKLLQSERLAAIGELAGMVGHDLRNPLMGITGAIYYLRTHAESKLNDLERRMLQIIENNVAYSNKIISDLQDYSKEIILKLKETNVKDLLKESLLSICIPNSVQIIDKTSESHKMTVDAAKMRRVFINIIKNALDAMPNGGKLMIASKQTKTHTEIVFSDTGVGIPADVLKKIGKPLFTTKAKGMGFGLAICNRIMDAHGGKLTIKSAIGKGTRVKLVLPHAKEKGI